MFWLNLLFVLCVYTQIHKDKSLYKYKTLNAVNPSYVKCFVHIFIKILIIHKKVILTSRIDISIVTRLIIGSLREGFLKPLA
jgi:hypothetical protein